MAEEVKPEPLVEVVCTVCGKVELQVRYGRRIEKDGKVHDLCLKHHNDQCDERAYDNSGY